MGRYTRRPWAGIRGDHGPVYAETMGRYTRRPRAGIRGDHGPVYAETMGRYTRRPWAGIRGDHGPVYAETMGRYTRRPWAGIRGDYGPVYAETTGRYTRRPWAGIRGDHGPVYAETMRPWAGIRGDYETTGRYTPAHGLYAETPPDSRPSYTPGIRPAVRRPSPYGDAALLCGGVLDSVRSRRRHDTPDTPASSRRPESTLWMAHARD
jgi:hypothetical protein